MADGEEGGALACCSAGSGFAHIIRGGARTRMSSVLPLNEDAEGVVRIRCDGSQAKDAAAATSGASIVRVQPTRSAGVRFGRGLN